MTQKELLEAMHAMQSESTHTRNYLYKCDIEFVLGLFRNVVGDALARGEAVELPGLARLSVKDQKAMPGRNPRTGEPITIPARRVVKVSVLKALKEKLGGTPGQAGGAV